MKRLRVSAHKLRQMLTHSDRAQARYDHLLPGEVYEARLRLQAAMQQYMGKPKSD